MIAYKIVEIAIANKEWHSAAHALNSIFNDYMECRVPLILQFYNKQINKISIDCLMILSDLMQHEDQKNHIDDYIDFIVSSVEE